MANKADPLWAQFDGLHQTSTALFMVGLAGAFACLIRVTQFRPRQLDPSLAAT